jgi:hypothetical protein
VPYISKKRAGEIDRPFFDLDCPIDEISGNIHSSGEFNYVLSRLAANRIKSLRVNYEHLKSVYGDMLLAAEEFRERLIVPYEAIKMQDEENADPYFDMFIEVTKK